MDSSTRMRFVAALRAHGSRDKKDVWHLFDCYSERRGDPTGSCIAQCVEARELLNFTDPTDPIVKVCRVGEPDEKLPVPSRATLGSSCLDLNLDLRGIEDPITGQMNCFTLLPGARHKLSTGYRWEFPLGWNGEIIGRSGYADKYGITLLDSREIDSDYRGPLMGLFVNLGKDPYTFKHGEFACQMELRQIWTGLPLLASELSSTGRGGDGGFGSTRQVSWGFGGPQAARVAKIDDAIKEAPSLRRPAPCRNPEALHGAADGFSGSDEGSQYDHPAFRKDNT
jgi:dUTP pyrophosphatase